MANYVHRYKPPIYEGNETMENLYTIQSQEIKNLNKIQMKIFDNCFVKTSDIDGIRKHESLYNVNANSDFTLEERRQNILNKMLFTPPFTRQKLDNILFNIYGQGGYTFEIFPDEFKVIIDINTNNPMVYLQFNKDVRNVIPANMDLLFAIQYTHLYLSRIYTYKKMETFTYGELSQFATETVEE